LARAGHTSLGATPLYNSYSDVFNAVDALACAIRP